MKESNVVFESNSSAILPRARARYLHQALQLEESRPSGVIRGAIFFTVFMLVALIAWAAMTDISEMAHARGEVVPAGLIHDVQHLEGGIVSAVYVRNGDRVSRGDVLVSFAPPASESELQQMQVRFATLSLEVERLQALLEGRSAAFGALGEQYPVLARQQATILAAQRASFRQELSVLDEQLAQRRAEQQRQLNKAEALKTEIGYLHEQVKIRSELQGKGLVSRAELLATQTQLAETHRAQREARDSHLVSVNAAQEVAQRRRQLESRFERDTQLEAGDVLAELAEVEQTVIRLKDKVKRLDVVAPIDGIVQAMAITSINAVVDPGEVILRIVPVQDEMIVEARVSPKDIGHVQSGQAADVKVDSYDAARFGAVEARLLQVSPSTYLDERGNPYYRAELKLAQAWVGHDSAARRIIPGMTVQANIRTGHKTLLEYLLRPISRGLGDAFHER